jgi:uncharacterized protein
MTQDPHYLKGLELYACGRYWDSHEEWEELWHAAKGTTRHFLQGLIQLDAALIHTERRHWRGVANLLRRALRHLEQCPGQMGGLDLTRLREEMRRYHEAIVALRDGATTEFDWDLKPHLAREDETFGTQRHSITAASREVVRMYTPLGSETLKNGEVLEIGVVSGPDAEWQPRIEPFLSHKGPGWNDHIQRALREPLDALQTLFYVGSVGGELVTQVMIVGHGGAGILGHVFTKPEHRRKGAYSRLMAHQMRDVPRRGFQVLTLGTGFDSHAYWIYHSFGFRSIRDGSGQMKWEAEAGAEERALAVGPVVVRPIEWTDWGALGLLAVQPTTPGESLPRSLDAGVLGQGNMEYGFIRLKLAVERQPQRRAVVLVKDSGLAVGWASLVPDERWFRQRLLLDVHTHPGFATEMLRLIEALPHGDLPVDAYVNAGGEARRTALKAAGFTQTAVLAHWLKVGEGREDVEVWTRV